MKILLITREKISCEKSNSGSCVLRELENCNYFRANKDKLAHIYLSKTTEINMQDDRIIDYSVNSVGNDSLQIPDLNPLAVKEIFGFFNDYNADIVLCYDKGYLGILGQIWAIRKKIPFVFTGLQDQTSSSTKTSKFLQFLFKSSGIAEEFIKNFYHNCTAILISKDEEKEDLNKINYEGSVIYVDPKIPQKEYVKNIYDELNKIIIAQPVYIRSGVFKKILSYVSFGKMTDNSENGPKKRSMNIDTVIFTGGAIAVSLIAFGAWKALSKIKEKVTKDPN